MGEHTAEFERLNLDKASVLLLTVEKESPGTINSIIGVIGEQKAKKLLENISKIGKVSADKRNEAINDFYTIALEKEFVFGGLDVSSKILKETFGINKAKEFLKNKKEKFGFFEDIAIDELKDFLVKETDQMKVFIFQWILNFNQ